MELAKADLLEKYQDTLAIEIDYENGCFEHEAAPAVQKFIHQGASIRKISSAQGLYPGKAAPTIPAIRSRAA